MLFIIWLGFLIVSIIYIGIYIHPYPPQDIGVGLGSAFLIISLVLVIMFSSLFKFLVVRLPKASVWKIIVGIIIAILIIGFLWQVIFYVADGGLMFWKSEEVMLDLPESNIDLINP